MLLILISISCTLNPPHHTVLPALRQPQNSRFVTPAMPLLYAWTLIHMGWCHLSVRWASSHSSGRWLTRSAFSSFICPVGYHPQSEWRGSCSRSIRVEGRLDWTCWFFLNSDLPYIQKLHQMLLLAVDSVVGLGSYYVTSCFKKGQLNFNFPIGRWSACTNLTSARFCFYLSLEVCTGTVWRCSVFASRENREKLYRCWHVLWRSRWATHGYYCI